jgi:jasmonate ZIM domain-containing protein
LLLVIEITLTVMFILTRYLCCRQAQAILLIAAAAAAATKSTNATVAKPPMTLAATAAQAGVSSDLTRALSLQSTSVATRQPQVAADPSSICKLQAGKMTSFRDVHKYSTFINVCCLTCKTITICYADLPIARRHSLQRFLEKRRDR